MATQQQLEAWFAAVDKDGSGSINVAELQQCLAQSGLNFSMKLVSSLIRMYDTDRTATYSKSEFFQLYGFLQRVQTTFAQFDRDRSGVLDLEEMYQALIALGYTLDKQPGGAYYTLCQSYDFNRSGKFKFEIFVAMCVTLHNGKAIFDAFARGAPSATLDFNQFVYGVSLV